MYLCEQAQAWINISLILSILCDPYLFKLNLYVNSSCCVEVGPFSYI